MALTVKKACDQAIDFDESCPVAKIVSILRRQTSWPVIVGSVLKMDGETYKALARYLRVDDPMSVDKVYVICREIMEQGRIAKLLGLGDDDELQPLARVEPPRNHD